MSVPNLLGRTLSVGQWLDVVAADSDARNGLLLVYDAAKEAVTAVSRKLRVPPNERDDLVDTVVLLVAMDGGAALRRTSRDTLLTAWAAGVMTVATKKRRRLRTRALGVQLDEHSLSLLIDEREMAGPTRSVEVAAMLARMTRRQRRAVKLVCLDKMSIRNAARILDVSAFSVRDLIKRGIARARPPSPHPPAARQQEALRLAEVAEAAGDGRAATFLRDYGHGVSHRELAARYGGTEHAMHERIRRLLRQYGGSGRGA